MRTSYSALQTYQLCPQKYKFQEIDRVPAKKSKAALFGTHLHNVLHYMFKSDPLFPTVDEVIDRFRSTWPAPEKFDVEENEKDVLMEAGERMLRAFYQKNPPWNYSVVDLESRFEVLVEDPLRKETHVLAGRIDRIDKTADGYEVIDYKTSRRIPSQADVDQDLQMSIYALGLQRRWPHVEPHTVTLSLYFLRHNEKLSTKRTIEANAATSEAVLKTISNIQETIAKGERFEPQPGPHCDTCPYKSVCPAWRHLYRRQEEESPTDTDMQAVIREYFTIAKSQKVADARLAALKLKIREYMEQQGFDRMFDEEGYIARSVQQRFSYDFAAVRRILEPLGKWESILEADEKKLKAILSSLPVEARTAIEAARVPTKSFTMLSTAMRPMRKPDIESPES